MEKTTIIAIILGVLVLVSAIQAFQLNGLKEKVADGQLTVSSSSRNAPATTSAGTDKKTAALPSSVKNLPQMVGGC